MMQSFLLLAMKYRAQQEGFIFITVRLQPFSSIDIAVYIFFSPCCVCGQYQSINSVSNFKVGRNWLVHDKRSLKWRSRKYRKFYFLLFNLWSAAGRQCIWNKKFNSNKFCSPFSWMRVLCFFCRHFNFMLQWSEILLYIVNFINYHLRKFTTRL